MPESDASASPCAGSDNDAQRVAAMRAAVAGLQQALSYWDKCMAYGLANSVKMRAG